MNGFLSDPTLYKEAMDNVASACSSFKGLSELLSDVSTKYPTGCPYVGTVNSVCSEISSVSSFFDEYSRHLEKNNDYFNDSSLESGIVEEHPALDDIKNMFLSTGADWKKGVSSLLNGNGLNDLFLALFKTKATIGVTYTSAMSGIGDIFELFSDAKVVLKTLPLAGVVKVFDTIKGTNYSRRIMDNTLDFVRRDRVGELNALFYENTEFGRNMNRLSNLKYDSEGAQAIRRGSEYTGKVALATAATIFSGGTLAFGLGAVYGVGKGAEAYVQRVDREHGEKYDYFEAFLRTSAASVTGGLDWWGSGALGSFAVGGVRSLASLAELSGAVGIRSTVKSVVGLFKNTLSNVTLRSFSKEYFKDFFHPINILASGAIISDNAVSYYYGDISSDEFKKNIRDELLASLIFSFLGASGKSFKNATDYSKELSIHQQLINSMNIDGLDGREYLTKLDEIKYNVPNAGLEDVINILDRYYDGRMVGKNGIVYNWSPDPRLAALLNKKYKDFTGYNHPKYRNEELGLIKQKIKDKQGIHVNGQPTEYQSMYSELKKYGFDHDVDAGTLAKLQQQDTPRKKVDKMVFEEQNKPNLYNKGIDINEIRNLDDFDSTEIIGRNKSYFDTLGDNDKEDLAFAIAKANYDGYNKDRTNFSESANEIMERIKRGHIPDKAESFELIETDQNKIDMFRRMCDIDKNTKNGTITEEDLDFLLDLIWGGQKDELLNNQLKEAFSSRIIDKYEKVN